MRIKCISSIWCFTAPSAHPFPYRDASDCLPRPLPAATAVSRTHIHTHTHGCDTGARRHALPGGGSREAGSRRPFPAFPVLACGGRWRDADPASDGCRDRLKPRGQTGYLDACERWGPPGSPPPWPMRTCPPGGGAGRGWKWEEIGNDTPGLPPPLAGETLYIRAPLPEIHDPTQPPG